MMPLSKAWLLLMGALSALVSGAIGLMIVASGGSPILFRVFSPYSSYGQGCMSNVSSLIRARG